MFILFTYHDYSCLFIDHLFDREDLCQTISLLFDHFLVWWSFPQWIAYVAGGFDTVCGRSMNMMAAEL